MKTRFATVAIFCILAASAWCQKRVNPLISMAVRLAFVESHVRSASHFLVEDALERHGSLAAPRVVQDAFDRISRVVPGKFTLHYVDDRTVNASSFATGDVLVNRGLYQAAHGDEAEIAMVIGHEFAHVVRRHAIARAVRAIIADTALYAIASNADTNPRDFVLTFARILARYSRDEESEADRFGFVYAMQAGYEPEGPLRAMEMIRGDGDSTAFIRDHPGGAERVARITDFIRAYRKGVPLEFIRYGKLDKDLEKGIGEEPSLELFSDPAITVFVNAPPSAYTMKIHPRFRVECAEEGFLSVLVQDPNGKVSCLFPNQYAPDGSCKPGTPVEIPSYTYRTGKKDLIRLRWDRPGDHRYLFVLSTKPVDWSTALGKGYRGDEFKDALLNVAESQESRVLGYGCETLSVR